MGHDNAGHHGYHHQPMTARHMRLTSRSRDLHRQTSVTPGTLIWHTAKKMTAGAGRANSREVSRCGAIWTDAANGSSVRYGGYGQQPAGDRCLTDRKMMKTDSEWDDDLSSSFIVDRYKHFHAI
ncbi:hypothetical protein PO124_31480 [Bacillus licheniformis]|nr:hypothetical protein [Bacillus licheniformis]